MSLSVSAHSYGPEAERALIEAIDRFKTHNGQLDPLWPVTVVVPTPIAGYHIRRSLGRRPGGLVNVQVKPLLALLELIGSAALAGAGRRPLPDALRAEMIRVVAEQGASMFGDVPIEGPLLHQLTQHFSELDECDPSQLSAIAAQPGVASHLVGLYEQYRTQTSQYYTNRDLAEAATQALGHRPVVLRDIGSVMVYLPDNISATHRRFLQALSEETDVNVLLGLTGDIDAVDRHTLERWGQPPSPADLPVPTAQMVIQSPDAEEEVRSAVRGIAASLFFADPVPLHRTAILFRQAVPYQRICAEQLDAAEITWNGRNSRTLGQSMAGRTLEGLLALMADPSVSWSSDVAPWLAAAPIRDSARELAPIARWNQLARRANLHRDPSQWTSRLQRYRARCLDDLARLQRIASDDNPGRLPWMKAEIGEIDALTEFAGRLADFAQQTPGRARWSDYANRARRQLEVLLGDRIQFAGRLSQDDDPELARWDDVQQLLTELSWLDDLEDATPGRFAAAAGRGLQRPTGHHGRFGDGVYVGPLSSAVGMQWDVVYIVGAAERSLPQSRSEDPLIPDQLRARASLPSSSDHLRRERSDFLAALHAAPRRVISYPRADMRAQRARLPGRWLLESATKRNGGQRIYASKIDRAPADVVQATPSFERSLTASRMPADLSEFDLRSIRRSSNPRSHYLVDEYPPLGRGFVQRRERRRSLLTRWNGLIEQGAAEELMRSHSASALQDWATCPYRYFLGRMLRIEERDEPRDELQITPIDKGSLIHAILDQFFSQTEAQPTPGTRWSKDERTRLEAIATEQLNEAHRQGLTGRELLWRRDRRRILNDLQTFLDRDEEHRAQNHTKQVASELAFGRLPDSQAQVDIALADGSTLPLRGIIDRVDRSTTGDRYIVIDYKTGLEFPRARELNNDPLVGGRFLQLPVYAHAARRVFGLDQTDSVGSAYWYITERGDFAYNPVEWNETQTEQFESAVNLIANDVRAGQFPANPGDVHPRAPGANCARCSFDAICPVDRSANWQRIKADPRLAGYIELSEGPDKEASDQ